MSTNFPYDCFLTEKVISLKDLEISPINFITDATKTTTYSTKTHISLFSDKKYRDLIELVRPTKSPFNHWFYMLHFLSIVNNEL